MTGVADSAPSFCELLSFVLTGIAPHLSCVVNNFPRDGRRAMRKYPNYFWVADNAGAIGPH